MTSKQLRELRGRPVSVSGNRIAVAFEISKRPQMDLVRETGLTPQYVTDVKAGRFQSITVDNARKFAEFFGCAIEDLFPAREAIAS
jgi:DNA-binding Xre family transcriptional regulator